MQKLISKRLLVLFAFTLVLLGCAQNQPFIEARNMVESGNVDQGLARMEDEARKHPEDMEIKNYLAAHRAVAVQNYLSAADSALSQGRLDLAEQDYRLAQRFDADNARAKAGLEKVAHERAAASKLAEAQAALKQGDQDQALSQAKQVLKDYPESRDAKRIVRKVEDEKVEKERKEPKLNAGLDKPITLEFRDAPLRAVFELISKRTGLNFVFDHDVPADARATVFVRDTSIKDVIHFVLVTNQLAQKVLNDNTLLVYPDTPAKRLSYKELTVKSFYLANADVKQTANMVRQLVKTRDMYVDEKLNMLVVRDTPEAVRMVEKLVKAQDLAEPEVMLDVQVMEVSYSKLQQLGIQWPGSIGVGLTGAAGTAGQITGNELAHLNNGLVRITVPDPLVQFNAQQQHGRTNVLANPHIRVKNNEQAKIHIGDRVPVITTTAGATGFVSESVNYLDVGLKLEVTPHVFLEDEVGIKIALEVSNIANQIKTSSGTTAYQLGTRNADTTLRLKDGETQVLAGLINDEDRRTANRVPGLADLPTFGRLFSNNDDTVDKTEVVLLITPHIVRNIERPGPKAEEFNSGTEAEVGGAPIALPSVSRAPGAPLLPPQPSQPALPPPPARPSYQPGQPSGQPSANPPGSVPGASDTFPPRPPAAGPAQKQ